MRKTSIFLTIITICFLFMESVFSQSSSNQSQKTKTIRVAGFQMETTSNIQTNKAVIINAIKKATKEGADFLMTPEGSLSGYNSTFDAKELNTALDQVVDIAKNLKIGLLLGTCYKENINGIEKCWNQVRVYTPNGNFLSAHSKVLVCSPTDQPGTGEMLEYEQGKPQIFDWNGNRFGILVCNDLWATPGYTTIPNPYLALKLKQMGAQVIFHAINSGTNQQYKSFHESSAELWSQSLGIQIMEVNAAKGIDPINAQSGLIKDGKRKVQVSYIGEQFFIVDITIPSKKKE